MQGGELWKVLELQINTPGNDATSGQAQESWAPLSSSVRARVVALSGDELIRARQVRSEVTHKITIRWRSGLSALQRFVDLAGRAYNILWFDDNGQRRGEAHCYCAVRKNT